MNPKSVPPSLRTGHSGGQPSVAGLGRDRPSDQSSGSSPRESDSPLECAAAPEDESPTSGDCILVSPLVGGSPSVMDPPPRRPLPEVRPKPPTAAPATAPSKEALLRCPNCPARFEVASDRFHHLGLHHGNTAASNLSATPILTQPAGIRKRSIDGSSSIGIAMVGNQWSKSGRLGQSAFAAVSKAALGNNAGVRLQNHLRALSGVIMDREALLSRLTEVLSPEQVTHFAVLAALSGPKLQSVRLAIQKLTLADKEVYAQAEATLGRGRPYGSVAADCMVAIPHWCARWLLEVESPPRLSGSLCPPCLQFVEAGHLPMSCPVRLLHVQYYKQVVRTLHPHDWTSQYLAIMSNQLSPSEMPAELLPVLGLVGVDVVETIGVEAVKRALEE